MDHPEFMCVDCKFDTWQDEYYMVTNEVWYVLAQMPQKGMLCIGCLEKRIGRQLTSKDFTGAPINTGAFFPQSKRLQERLRAPRN